MRFKIYRSFVLALILVAGVFLANAQSNGKGLPNTSSPKTGRTSPYNDGEILSYDGKYSKLILRGISVAELTFTVNRTSDDKNYFVRAEARSKGTLIKLLRFSFLQNIESTIDGEKFTVLKTIKRDEQGDRIRNSEANFDYVDKKVTYLETDPKDASRPPRRIASSIEDETYDLISGIYILRYLPLVVGKTLVLNVSDSGMVYQVPVRVTARENQNTIFGKIPCWRVEPEVFGPGRMIENDGNMTIWLTDDNRRLPVRAVLNTSLGKIEVKLKRVGRRQKSADQS